MMQPVGHAGDGCGGSAGLLGDIAVGEAISYTLGHLPAGSHFFEFSKRAEIAEEKFGFSWRFQGGNGGEEFAHFRIVEFSFLHSSLLGCFNVLTH